jgi:hypothetical protein
MGVSEERTAYIFNIEEKSKQELRDCSLLFAGFLLDFHFDSEDGASNFFRNVAEREQNYMTSHA